MGYYPFLVLGHNTADCIATQGLGGKAGHATGSAWPGTLQYGTATLRHKEQRAHHGIVSRHNFCVATGAACAQRHGAKAHACAL